MLWNSSGTLEIREKAPFDTGHPPNKEAKIRSRGGRGRNEFCILSNRAVLRERLHCAFKIITVCTISLDVPALYSHKVLYNISF